MRVARVVRRHLLDVGSEQALAVKDTGVLGKETENQPRHELVQVLPARVARPVRVLFQQLDVKLVEAARRPDVDRVVFDLRDGRDAGKWQEKSEVVGKIAVGAGDRLTGSQLLGFEVDAVGGEYKLDLALRGFRTRL